MSDLTPSSVLCALDSPLTPSGHTPRTPRPQRRRPAFLDRFEREVDPDDVLTPQERARLAKHARKAYFARLALKSAQARARNGRGRAA